MIIIDTRLSIFAAAVASLSILSSRRTCGNSRSPLASLRRSGAARSLPSTDANATASVSYTHLDVYKRQVQNTVSFNAEAGVTRGLHAEPWDKFVSIGHGRIFGAWCDLREGSATYGKVFTLEMDPSRAIFVPRGVANGFQALENNTVYMYLVNDHWSPEADYAFVNLADPELHIDWPISLDQATMSDKDKSHPPLKSVTPLKPKKVMITGANGQLGRALRELYPDADYVGRDGLDISDETTLQTARRWRDYGIIVNAAAYTAVDTAETPEGRREAWATNARAVGNLARICLLYTSRCV